MYFDFLIFLYASIIKYKVTEKANILNQASMLIGEL